MEFGDYQEVHSRIKLDSFSNDSSSKSGQLSIETLMEKIERKATEKQNVPKSTFLKTNDFLWQHRSIRILTQGLKPEFCQRNTLVQLEKFRLTPT